MPEARPPRRKRCPPAPTVDPRTRQHELVDLMAAGLERLALCDKSADIPANEKVRGDGLELPRHAALSVSAGFPGSERRGPNKIKSGESV